LGRRAATLGAAYTHIFALSTFDTSVAEQRDQAEPPCAACRHSVQSGEARFLNTGMPVNVWKLELKLAGAGYRGTTGDSCRVSCMRRPQYVLIEPRRVSSGHTQHESRVKLSPANNPRPAASRPGPRRAQARCSRRCSAAASSDPCILFVGPRERSDKAPDALTASSTPVRGAVSQPSRLLQVGRRAEDRDVASAHADWTVGVLY
jgi:hypothetical protein